MLLAKLSAELFLKKQCNDTSCGVKNGVVWHAALNGDAEYVSGSSPGRWCVQRGPVRLASGWVASVPCSTRERADNICC